MRALLVELENKTLYFNSFGINEFEIPINVGIMIGEEIIIKELQKIEIKNMSQKKLYE